MNFCKILLIHTYKYYSNYTKFKQFRIDIGAASCIDVDITSNAVTLTLSAYRAALLLEIHVDLSNSFFKIKFSDKSSH